MTSIQIKINELNTQKQTIQNRLNEITDDLTANLIASGQSSIDAPKEFIDLDNQLRDIDDRLWYLHNPDTRFYQLLIERFKDDINAHKESLKKLDSLNMTITREDGTTVNDFYKNHIKHLEMRISELEELKHNI